MRVFYSKIVVSTNANCVFKTMKFTYFFVLYASTFLFYPNDGAKILGIFPLPAKSHFTCNNAIMKSLIDAGHEVTVITSFAEQASAQNYSSIIDVRDGKPRFVGKKFDQFISQNVFKFLNLFTEVEFPFCSRMLNLPEIQRIFNSNEKLYDVVFVEVLFFYKCFLPVAEKMQVPVIGTVTLRTWLFADLAISNPNHPTYLPFELVTQAWNLDHINGRIINLWSNMVIRSFKNFVLPRMMRQFHEAHAHQLTSLGKYMDMEPDLIFYNNHPSLLSRPINPNAIEIGGIHTQDAKPLPEDIQKFIDEADQGVILFSLGSIARAASLSAKNQKAFKDAFAEIPQRVIWKFEEEIDNLSSNVMILSWLPQRDILEHKNVIAFISHCGLGGMNEAVYTATPVVACPLFCDQPDNAEFLENVEVAVHLDIYDITKENVLNALNAIVNDTKYYNNMQKLSKQFKDRPMTPQQNVVYWTEYVIRHNGAPHLKSSASRLSWYQFFMLDVLLVVSCILVIFIYFVRRLLKIFSIYFTRVRFSNVFDKPKNKKL